VQGSGVESPLGPLTRYLRLPTRPTCSRPGTYFWYVKAYDGSSSEIGNSAAFCSDVRHLPARPARTDRLSDAHEVRDPRVLHGRARHSDSHTGTGTGCAAIHGLRVTRSELHHTSIGPTRRPTRGYPPRDSWLDNQANQAYYWFVRPARNTTPADMTAWRSRTHPPIRSGRRGIHPLTPADAATVSDEITFSWQDFLASNRGLAAPGDPGGEVVPDPGFDPWPTSRRLLDDKTVDETFFTEFDRTYPEGPL